MAEKVMNCANGHGEMKTVKVTKTRRFRGTDLFYKIEICRCPECGLEAGSLEQTKAAQKAISDAYRNKVGLLTGKDIRKTRKEHGLSQGELADRMSVGVASIKRWEGSFIQSKSMDRSLRHALKGQKTGNIVTGNRTFSLKRIKQVLKNFESALGKELIKSDDRFLFAAKYLWYADMIAFRELGRSMTGATYARLPMGPQLNNYRDLVDDIKKTDISSAKPLLDDEKRIITKISKIFPSKWDVYRAAHREKLLEGRSVGELIPYSDATKITEL